jgi:catechol 2,3-dioxygenase-like lactoylglutathione lyase family enzyme
MRTAVTIALAAACLAAPACAQRTTTPEGAVLDVAQGYQPGELTTEQLAAPTRALFVQDSMNVFRRYDPSLTPQMVKFYVEALALRSLNPIQLTATQQMILTGVGSGQIKLSAGQQGTRKYDLSGGYRAGTGIRFFVLTYPDAAVVRQRFVAAGFAAPGFVAGEGGVAHAFVKDPGGFEIVLTIRPGAKDHSDDGVGVGIGVSDLAKSRAFYREFVGLDELPPIDAKALRAKVFPYRHKETTLLLYEPEGATADNGSAGIQYVVSDAALVDAKAKSRAIAVEQPLNKLQGFDLTTVWLNDPDGVTNYFAQVGPNSRTAREREK